MPMNDLIQTIEAIQRCEGEEGEKLLVMINIIANLMYECEETRVTAATYTRIFTHKKLTVVITYNV